MRSVSMSTSLAANAMAAAAANGQNPYGIALSRIRPHLPSPEPIWRRVAVGMHGTVTGTTLPAPTFTPPAGSYTTSQMVTLGDATTSATICYTTNGNTPTASVAGTCDTLLPDGQPNGELSTPAGTGNSPVTVATSETVMAIATEAGYLNSGSCSIPADTTQATCVAAGGTWTAIASAKYIIGAAAAVAAPTFSVTAGTYTLKTSTSTLSVVLSDATSGATICYTTSGTAPATTAPGTCSTSIAGELGVPSGTTITVASTETVQALGTLAGDVNSAVVTATYTLIPSDPTFSPKAETFYQSYNTGSYPMVTATTSTGATILYCYVAAGQPACTPNLTGITNGVAFQVGCASGAPPCDTIFYLDATFPGNPASATSGVSHAKYSIKPGDPPGTPHAATPTLSPTPGPITPCSNPAYTTQSTCVAAGDTWTPVSVTISDSSTGVCSIPTYTTQATCTGATPTAGIWTPDIPVICYTLDGAVPAVNAATGACTTGTLYTVPVPLNAVEGNIYTIRAVAGGTGYLQSEPIAKGEYIFR
jgi:hypothetical protein